MVITWNLRFKKELDTSDFVNFDENKGANDTQLRTISSDMVAC